MHELAVGVDGQPAFGVRSDVVDVRVALVEHSALVDRLPAQRAHAILPLPQGRNGLPIPREQSAQPRRTTLRVRHAVRGQEQSRHELHPTVEGCFGRWLIEGHLEGAFYAVCVLLEEHRIVLLPVQVQQLLDGHIQAVPQPQGRFGFPFPCSAVPLSTHCVAVEYDYHDRYDGFELVLPLGQLLLRGILVG